MSIKVEVGESHEAVIAEDLTRTALVQYAGASGDYNPLHTDERFATEIAGYPSVFAHGMLTMGMSGRVLTDWFGPEGLRAYGVRFVKQVFPGDTLTAKVTVTELHEVDGARVAELEVETTNQDGDVVVRGTATAALD
jgi:acyl dehydratase